MATERAAIPSLQKKLLHIYFVSHAVIKSSPVLTVISSLKLLAGCDNNPSDIYIYIDTQNTCIYMHRGYPARRASSLLRYKTLMRDCLFPFEEIMLRFVLAYFGFTAFLPLPVLCYFLASLCHGISFSASVQQERPTLYRKFWRRGSSLKRRGKS